MNILQRRLNKYFEQHHILNSDHLNEYIQDSNDERALSALADIGCVKILYTDNKINSVYRGKKADTYLMQRSELWFNRIVAYVAGIISSFLVQWLIRTFL